VAVRVAQFSRCPKTAFSGYQTGEILNPTVFWRSGVTQSIDGRFLMNPIQPFLAQQGFVMLDGALATELERRGADLNHDLWSARMLIEAPEMICDVSHSYLLAGADIIATASYQASFEGFARAGIEQNHAANLMQLSVDLAVLARENFWSVTENRRSRLRPLVAASIGPYGACLADGSEYHGNYDLSRQDLIDFHRPRMTELAHSDADLLAFETIPSMLEAEALIELLSEFPASKAWLSFSCRDEAHVCHGELFSDCAALADQADQLIAVGINCTAPEYVTELLGSARARAVQKPLMAYPNSGESWIAGEHKWTGQARGALKAKEWYDAGARMIGGCCRTGPADIERMRSELGKR
jgi:homocysteine S-methyltransferase